MACQPLPSPPVGTPAASVKQQPVQVATAIAPNLDGNQMVEIHKLNSKIRLDIRYATTNNFTHHQLYVQARCVLRASVAQQLAQVQIKLEQQGLGLKVYDCYRPLSVQKQMWAIVPDSRYVANPAVGSRHNRGSAVDVTLVDRNGNELEMPSGFDDFSDRAHLDYMGASLRAQQNRQHLRTVMEQQGFVALSTEWWHFDAQDWQRFPLVNIPFQSIPL
jgi:D-alanyl-D-alanine dipeptidase